MASRGQSKAVVRKKARNEGEAPLKMVGREGGTRRKRRPQSGS